MATTTSNKRTGGGDAQNRDQLSSPRRRSKDPKRGGESLVLLTKTRCFTLKGMIAVTINRRRVCARFIVCVFSTRWMGLERINLTKGTSDDVIWWRDSVDVRQIKIIGKNSGINEAIGTKVDIDNFELMRSNDFDYKWSNF